MRKHIRHFKGRAFGKLGFCTSWAAHKDPLVPQWLEIVKVPLRIGDISDELVGRKIVQVSDIHCSRTVSRKYLNTCVGLINGIDPDLVFLTGDYITHDIKGRYSKKVIELISQIKSKYGVYACLGNHDYGIGSMLGSWRDELLYSLIDGLEACGVKVLRNDSTTVEIENKPLSIIGLGDLWAGDFDPDKAFSKVFKGHPSITLLHNPDGVKHLDSYEVGTIMSGHTHGVRSPILMYPGWKFKMAKYYSGLYHIGDKKLYVNKGLGRLGKTLFNVRPEITVFTLC